MMNELPAKSCSVCAFSDLKVFFTLPKTPICTNLLWSERQAALDCPQAEIKLAFCPNCGFISNVTFDPAQLIYNPNYDNSLHYSPRFQDYSQSLASHLIKRHNLYHKNIIEIGCGGGDFLLALCELGQNQGVGFDPSYRPKAEHQQLTNRVQFIQDYYSEKYKAYQADFIVCRHTLEHIPNPTDLLKSLREAIGDRLNTVVFFEVPNGLDTFRNLAIWDIIYEHCCYFSSLSLIQAFSSSGFKVCEIEEAFDSQFLCLEAMPIEEREQNLFGINDSDKIEYLVRDIQTFQAKFNALINDWQNKLLKFTQARQKVVLWGAGAKGVTFLNLHKNQNAIEYVVDLNPNKQGKYIAGTGQKIVAPDFLQDYQPDVVIIINPIYQQEIQKLCASLGLYPQLITH